MSFYCTSLNNGWASFNNPAGLNISGTISLEAWVQPGVNLAPVARIISHGPPTISSYEAFVGTVDPAGADFVGAVTNTSEVFLLIDHGTNYSVGSAKYDDGNGTTTVYAATYPVPDGDIGASAWVHLVGTYDGANWKLYRNGQLVATQAGPTGALTIDGGDWAVGATGMGWADNLRGAIDEVAIYNTALSAAQVSAHYNAAKSGSLATFAIKPAGSNTVIITWPSGATLQQSTTVNGTYADVPGSPVSPLTIPATATMFYRLKM
ncbi:MAG TPA: LamG domain-containing protein [Verrucomicrobiae bacterium]|nr:LamG domain-containing protein [Verrucomicrobiae bacterium]